MEAIFRLPFGWLGAQTAQLAISQIDPVHFTLLALRIKRVAIGWIEQDIKTVASGKRCPIAVANPLLTLHAARSDPVLVILQAARNPEIQFRVVERDPIEFARGNLVHVVPILATGK